MLNFLERFPREIRDQIYGDVLGSETGIVIFLPSPLSPRAEVVTSTFLIETAPSYHSNTKGNTSLRSSSVHSQSQGTAPETNKDTSTFKPNLTTPTPQAPIIRTQTAKATPNLLLSTANTTLPSLLSSTTASRAYIIQQFTPWAQHEYTLSHSQRITLNITQTCRQVYHETRGIFWKLNQVWGADVNTWRLVQEIRGASQIRWSDLAKKEEGKTRIEVGKRDQIAAPPSSERGDETSHIETKYFQTLRDNNEEFSTTSS